MHVQVPEFRTDCHASLAMVNPL